MIEFLYRALRSPNGVCITMPKGFDETVAELEIIRSNSKDPALQCLSFHRSPYAPDKELWIANLPPMLTMEDVLNVDIP